MISFVNIVNHRKLWLRLVSVILLILVLSSLGLTQDLFTIARVKYDGGGDWYSNPSSLPNLLKFVRENTGIKTAEQEAVIDLSDPRLVNYPYLYLNGHGNISFTDREAKQLREYLESGGFLHADDNYGMDKAFRREMKKVIPEMDFVEIPFNHAIYHSHYRFATGPPKIHEHDGKPPQGLGLFIDGNLVVYYTYESDLGDGWEDPDVHDDPAELRLAALKMGTNIIVWRLRGGH